MRSWGGSRRCGPARGRLAAARGAWLVFEDEADFSMMPPHAKTWSPRDRTPVVRVRVRSRHRLSITALTGYKPGHRSRLIYRLRRDDGNRNGRKSFSWRKFSTARTRLLHVRMTARKCTRGMALDTRARLHTPNSGSPAGPRRRPSDPLVGCIMDLH